jgi:Peptidase family S41/Tricorn protease C1 domain
MRLCRRKMVLLLTLLSLLPTVAVWAVPPKVIETVPRNGDLNVDPEVREMRFVFDQDMRRSGYSICGGGPMFPKTVGRPRWVDTRTLVMRVQLVPDHEYRLSINCPSAKKCRSVRGESAVPYPVQFRTAGNGSTARITASSPQTNAQAAVKLREAIDTQYSYKDLRGLDWAGLFAKYTPALQRAKNAAAFAETAAKLLGQARDMHIWVEVNGTTVHPFKRDIVRNYNLDTLAKVVPGFRKRSAVVYTGQFDNGVGYLRIDSWSHERAAALEQAYVAIWEFSDAPGLIVDVRPNGGGAEPLAQEFAGCFVDEPVLYAKHVYRASDEANGFGRPQERILQPNKRRPKYRGKVAVLMGPANMSSCEAFLLMMKQVPGCKLIGATSYGSSGNPKPVDLGNGVTVYLPSWKALRPNSTCFEGQGIAPDITISVTPTELATADPVLQAALILTRKR